MIQSLISLITLILLEIVLSIDNLIFVSIIVDKLPSEKQKLARKYWMMMGILSRTILLFIITWLIHNPYTLSIFEYKFEVSNFVMIAGGIFLILKTVSEIHEKLEGNEQEKENQTRKQITTFTSAIVQICIIDIMFSFENIVTAVSLSNQLIIMILAVIIAMFLMFTFSSVISKFMTKHPTLKMLALMFLVVIGFCLFFDGFKPVHHHEINKSYIYFAMGFAFIYELINIRIRKRTKKPVILEEPHE